MKYIIQISTPPNFSDPKKDNSEESKPEETIDIDYIKNKRKKSKRNIKNIDDLVNIFSNDNIIDNTHEHSPKEIVEQVIEKIIYDPNTVPKNPIGEFRNHINFKRICSYLEKYKIKYKQSITVNGFILDCSLDQLNRLIKYNKNIIDLVVKDTKIALHQPLPADLYNKVNPKMKQWSLSTINVTPLWKKNIKGNKSLIAIFDTGVDVSHCQLKDNYSGIWKDFINKNHEETKNEPYDDNGHGTFICGIACGSNINDFVIGVAPEAKWLCCKILNYAGIGLFSSFIEACDYLIMKGIYPEAISCSFDFITKDDKIDQNYIIMVDGIMSMLESYNVLVCFSSGNNGKIMNYPPCLSGVFTTGAFDFDNKMAQFNCYGTHENISKPDIVAPGVNILSCVPKIYLPDEDDIMFYDKLEYKYCMFSGTSFACAYICGCTALIVQILNKRKINYNVELIKDILTQNLFKICQTNTKDNHINELYYNELGKHKLNTTITKLVSEKNKHYNVNDKYIDHPIKGMIKPVPLLDKSTVYSLHPKYPYLNLSWLYHCFEKIINYE